MPDFVDLATDVLRALVPALDFVFDLAAFAGVLRALDALATFLLAVLRVGRLAVFDLGLTDLAVVFLAARLAPMARLEVPAFSLPMGADFLVLLFFAPDFLATDFLAAAFVVLADLTDLPRAAADFLAAIRLPLAAAFRAVVLRVVFTIMRLQETDQARFLSISMIDAGVFRARYSDATPSSQEKPGFGVDEDGYLHCTHQYWRNIRP